MTEVVIVRPAALGDTLMLLPALSGMADGTEVTVVGRAPGGRAARSGRPAGGFGGRRRSSAGRGCGRSAGVSDQRPVADVDE